MTNLVFTVGNAMMGDDGAGPLLAELLERDPAPGWAVIDGGSAPENVMHAVRAAAPSKLLLVDAADMGLDHGAVRRIDPAQVADTFLIDTHAIPLDFLIASLAEDVPDIVFVGVQPARVAFYEDMTPAVRAGVQDLHRRLAAGEDPAGFAPVA
ncbi:hydrogenase 3 maturation protease [Rhodoblastus acidophilus]|uniref:hydrogenase maturation peptidase HycI n=1 Tax=Rhodoblastus acidophilus TaxID=1074 RepID=UPI0022254530|nr:hydrogenase maturation peptidase HycI [Rhodoblastus acidophilus]MCW2285403.1 hydrogenase 3 maturation protease [Rhodoblastus acidophilus]MCW2334348.1 hydrogenase 3 maturation protease [Rhodoblastus acidophilus]